MLDFTEIFDCLVVVNTDVLISVTSRVTIVTIPVVFSDVITEVSALWRAVFRRRNIQLLQCVEHRRIFSHFLSLTPSERQALLGNFSERLNLTPDSAEKN